MVNTDFPVKRYTAVQYTQPAAAISPLSKSTRHLLVPEPDPRYYYTHRAHQETITIDRDNLKHGKKHSLNLKHDKKTFPSRVSSFFTQVVYFLFRQMKRELQEIKIISQKF